MQRMSCGFSDFAGALPCIGDVAVTDFVHPPEPTLDQVQALITQRGPSGLIASDPIWLSAFRVNERKVGDYEQAVYSWQVMLPIFTAPQGGRE